MCVIDRDPCGDSPAFVLVQEDSDKVRFFEGLASQISRLPAEIGVHKVLPVFRDYVRVEGTAQQVGGGV